MIWPFGRYVFGACCSPYIVSPFSSTAVHRQHSHNIIARRIIKPFEQLNMHSGEQLATLCARATWYRYDIRLLLYNALMYAIHFIYEFMCDLRFFLLCCFTCAVRTHRCNRTCSIFIDRSNDHVGSAALLLLSHDVPRKNSINRMKMKPQGADLDVSPSLYRLSLDVSTLTLPITVIDAFREFFHENDVIHSIRNHRHIESVHKTLDSFLRNTNGTIKQSNFRSNRALSIKPYGQFNDKHTLPCAK